MTIPSYARKTPTPPPNGDRVALVAHLTGMLLAGGLTAGAQFGDPAEAHVAIIRATGMAQMIVDAAIAAERSAGR